MKAIKTIKKIFAVIFFTAAAILLIVTVFAYSHKDKLVQLVTQEANKSVQTPLSIKETAFTFKKFPQIAVKLKEVSIQGSLGGSHDSLARAQKIYITFNIWDILQDRYVVNQIYVEKAEIFVQIAKNGQNNYTVVKKDTIAKNRKLSIDLEQVNLKEVNINFLNKRHDQHYVAFAKDVKAHIAFRGDEYHIDVAGKLKSQKIQLARQKYFQGKQVRLSTKLLYHRKEKVLHIHPTKLEVDHALFMVEGKYTHKAVNIINLQVEAKNANLKSITSLLPDRLNKNLKPYKSKGNIHFKGSVKGAVSRSQSPAIDISFDCADASFYHPKYKKTIEAVSFKGHFSNGKQRNQRSTTLVLEDITGILEKRIFSCNLSIHNFEDYYLKCNFTGVIDINSALAFYPIKKLKKAGGIADFDISIEGSLNDFKRVKTIPKVKTLGKVDFKDFSFHLEGSKLPFKGLNGRFIFNNNNITINNLWGSVGDSHFHLNGFLKNIIAFLAFEDQTVGIEADLKSHFVDLDELLSSDLSYRESTAKQNAQYTFKISPYLQLAFNCDIDLLKFRRFRGRHIQGRLIVREQKVDAQNVRLNTAGGQVYVDGSVNAQKETTVQVGMKAGFRAIHIDSLFYIFENFNQTFLIDRHLKGQVYADVAADMLFDDKLRLNVDRLVTQVDISIKNGELNNFEPMQRLSKYVEEESLTHMRFADLANQVFVKDKKVFLPAMTVVSNVSSIQIHGTYTFDHHISYKVQVPLKKFITIKDKDAAFGAIQDDGLGNANLFLVIEGTTSDYEVRYDTQALKAKLREDIKKEGEELKHTFINKGNKKEEVKELNEDEYFDFDDEN